MRSSSNVLKVSLYYFLLTTGSYLIPLSIAMLFNISYLDLVPTGFGTLVFGVIVLVLLVVIQTDFWRKIQGFLILLFLEKVLN